MEVHDIMQTKQDAAEHLFFVQEMMDICFSEILTCVTSAISSYGSEILDIFCIGKFDISFSGKSFSMSA